MRVYNLFSILEDVKLPKRAAEYGVGKKIGGKVYIHKSYENVLPKELLENAKSHTTGFKYNVVSYDSNTGNITFTQSPDFDTAPEPMIGSQMLVKPDGTVRTMKPQSDPWIYHHKWLMVRDDYPGFNVEDSKRRSVAWMSTPGVDYSRIGKKSFWEKNVVPNIKRK